MSKIGNSERAFHLIKRHSQFGHKFCWHVAMIFKQKNVPWETSTGLKTREINFFTSKKWPKSHSFGLYEKLGKLGKMVTAGTEKNVQNFWGHFVQKFTSISFCRRGINGSKTWLGTFSCFITILLKSLIRPPWGHYNLKHLVAAVSTNFHSLFCRRSRYFHDGPNLWRSETGHDKRIWRW